jgi:hypothetical protein
MGLLQSIILPSGKQIIIAMPHHHHLISMSGMIHVVVLVEGVVRTMGEEVFTILGHMRTNINNVVAMRIDAALTEKIGEMGSMDVAANMITANVRMMVNGGENEKAGIDQIILTIALVTGITVGNSLDILKTILLKTNAPSMATIKTRAAGKDRVQDSARSSRTQEI